MRIPIALGAVRVDGEQDLIVSVVPGIFQVLGIFKVPDIQQVPNENKAFTKTSKSLFL